MANARKTLQHMYDHFEQGHPVKEYLYSHCIHLLEKPSGNTGISTKIFNISDYTQK
jgi:hypothetical protein